MKKHGRRMETAGGAALFFLALAADGGQLSITALAALAALSIGVMLLGERFTRPLRKPRPAPLSPVCPAASGTGNVISFPSARQAG